MRRLIGNLAISLTVILVCLPKVGRSQPVSGAGWIAETSTGPAAANFGGNIFLAWKGASGNHIWYTGDGSHQEEVAGALTTQSPALAAAGTNFYLAWRGQSTATTDKIYYSKNTGAGFGSQMTICETDGDCAETIASPALTASGSTLYAAWTTSSDGIMLGVFDGAWTFLAMPASFQTNAAPALVVYGGELFLAWVNEGTTQLMYATSPLATIKFSAETQVMGPTWTAQTSVSPAFGVFNAPVPPKGPSLGGLFLGWTTEGTITIDYSKWNGAGWNAPASMPTPSPDIISNASPAFVSYSTGAPCETSNYYFDVAYKNGADNIIFTQLADEVIPPCVSCCPLY